MADIDIKVRIQAQKAQAQLAKLTAQTKRAEAQTAKFSAQADKASLSVKKASLQNKILEQRLTRVNRAARNGASAFKVFAGNLAAIGFSNFLSTLTSFAREGVQAGIEVENLSTQFKVLTGSTELARNAVADLTTFAANTPFQLKDLGKAQTRLLSFGFSLEQSQAQLKVLGDVAAASNANIGELSLIFGQVAAAGKLTGERLLQLQERAIPIGPALAKSMGVAESAVRQLVTDGKVGFAEFEKAFNSLNETGEFAFEGMIERSRTLDGRLSTLRDTIELSSASLLGKFAPALKGAVSTLTLFIQRIASNREFNAFIDFLVSKIPTAIGFVIDAVNVFANSFLNVIKVFNLVRAGIAKVATFVLSSLSKMTGGVASFLNAFGLADTSIGKGVNGIRENLKLMADAAGETGDSFVQKAVTVDAAQKKLNETIAKGKDFVLSTLAAETKAAKEQGAIQDAATAKKIENNNREIESNKKKKANNKNTVDSEIKDLKDLFAAQQELAFAQEEQRLLQGETETIFRDERLLAVQEAFTLEEQAAIQSKLNLLANAVERETLITKAVTDGTRNRTAIIEKAAEDRKKIEETKNQALLTGTQGLFGALASVARSGGKKNFKIYKALASAEVVLATVTAVQKAAASALPPFNIPAIATEVIRGGVNLAKVNATTPRFEQGGIVPGGSFSGDNVIARVNSGEMILNRQQQMNLFKGINNGNMGGGPIQVTTNVEVDGETIARAVSNQVANGFEIGEVR